MSAKYVANMIMGGCLTAMCIALSGSACAYAKNSSKLEFGISTSKGADVHQIELKTGMHFSVISIYYSDEHIPKNLASKLALLHRKYGAIPLVTMHTKARTLDEITKDIIDKDDKRSLYRISPDDFYKVLAMQFKKYGKVVYFRWNQEMNGAWVTPYCTVSSKCIDPDNGKKRRASDFIAAWRHIHDVFTKAGADKVQWVWCPAVQNVGGMRDLYPGDAYVDWLCLDGYNWSPPKYWMSFYSIFNKAYKKIAAIAPSKKIMIGEFNTGLGIPANDRRRGLWYENAYCQMTKNMPLIDLAIIFNHDVPEKNVDWRIQKSRSIIIALRKISSGKLVCNGGSSVQSK